MPAPETDTAPPGSPHQDPVPVRRYRAVSGAPDGAPGGAPGGAAAPTLVWLHGGGFFRGSIDQPEAHAVASALASRGVDVVTVDYRLAPLPGLPWLGRRGPRSRARWPHAHDDVVAAFRDARSRAAGAVLLGGASAGACLASSATLRLLDEDGPHAAPDGVALAYGFHHARLPRDRVVLRGVRGHRRVTHAPWALDFANRSAVGRHSRHERGAFAGGQDLSGFPSTLAVDAEHDAMRASGDRFVDELRGAGAPVERFVLAGSRHAFLDRPESPWFLPAIEHIAAWATRPGHLAG